MIRRAAVVVSSLAFTTLVNAGIAGAGPQLATERNRREALQVYRIGMELMSREEFEKAAAAVLPGHCQRSPVDAGALRRGAGVHGVAAIRERGQVVQRVPRGIPGAAWPSGDASVRGRTAARRRDARAARDDSRPHPVGPGLSARFRPKDASATSNVRKRRSKVPINRPRPSCWRSAARCFAVGTPKGRPSSGRRR